MFRKRRRIVTGLVAGVGLLTAAGVVATTIVQSPQQAAAQAQPPEPSVITAPVVRRVLTDTVVMRGTVRPATTVEVAPAGSARGDVRRQLVTKVAVKAGEEVEPASLLMEVSGRPVFALEGDIPAYRDLRPGLEGDDIRQFQSALSELGLSTGSDPEGVFGAGTAQAVRDLYQDLGYEPLPAPPGTPSESAGQREAPATGEPAAPAGQSGAAALPGPMVPVSELVYLPGFPARVDSVSARVGSEAGKKLLTLSTGKLYVHGVVNGVDRGLVHSGQQVEIHSELSGITRSGEVDSIAEDVSTPADAIEDGADGAAKPGSRRGAGYLMRVAPKKPLPAELAHQDVRLTIQAASSEGKVLVVPVSAVSAKADSRTSVTVREEGGRRRTVPVRVRMSADGCVAVSPVGKGSLEAGDDVIVGVEQAGRGELP